MVQFVETLNRLEVTKDWEEEEMGSCCLIGLGLKKTFC